LRVPVYQRDLDEYLCLTAEGNRFLDGQVKDWDPSLSPSDLASSRLLSGGKIISVFSDRKGHLRNLRLFHPFSDAPLPPSDQSVRAFYRPEKEVQGKAVDGVYLGYQAVERAPEAKRGMSFDEYADSRTVN
jgi:hypothetical protein